MPSLPLMYHLLLHVLPYGPAVQAAAAPIADFLRRVSTLPAVKGARMEVPVEPTSEISFHADLVDVALRRAHIRLRTLR